MHYSQCCLFVPFSPTTVICQWFISSPILSSFYSKTEQKVESTPIYPLPPPPIWPTIKTHTRAVHLIESSTHHYHPKSTDYIKVHFCVIHFIGLDKCTVIHMQHQFHGPKNPFCSRYSSFPPPNPWQPLILLSL